MPQQWWQGNQGAGATTGYGTFEARPAAPESPVLDALIDDDTAAEPAMGINQQQQQKNPNQGYIDMLKRNLMSLQGQLSLAMNSGDQQKIKSIQYHLIMKQNEIREKEFAWSQKQGA